MGRTVADLKTLREELVRRRWQAAYAVADDLDGEGLYTLVIVVWRSADRSRIVSSFDTGTSLPFSALRCRQVLACDDESSESDREEVFHDRRWIAADAGD